MPRPQGQRGSVERVGHGIYRFVHIPVTERDPLMLATLWPAGQGVLSHDTALELHELCDVNPVSIHLTVPPALRLRRRGGEGYMVHREHLAVLTLLVLRHLPAWIERRKQIAEHYRQGLSDLPELLLPHYGRPGFDHVYQNYTLRSKQGSEFSDYLKSQGVEILTQFRKPYYRHEVCSLPMYPELSDEEVDTVIAVVRSFYKR